MKRALMALSVAMVVVGCSGSQPSNTTVLTPLVTTTSSTTTTTMFPDPNMAFLFSLTQSFGNFDGYYSQIEALLQGNQYCIAARGGMTAFTITDSINEGAETAEEIRLELSIVTSALTYLCPDQEYRINP